MTFRKRYSITRVLTGLLICLASVLSWFYESIHIAVVLTSISPGLWTCLMGWIALYGCLEEAQESCLRRYVTCDACAFVLVFPWILYFAILTSDAKDKIAYGIILSLTIVALLLGPILECFNCPTDQEQEMAGAANIGSTPTANSSSEQIQIALQYELGQNTSQNYHVPRHVLLMTLGPDDPLRGKEEAPPPYEVTLQNQNE